MRASRALPRPLLQLVRNAASCARSIRSTSPRSTAATSPATCSTLRGGVPRARRSPAARPAGAHRRSPTRSLVLREALRALEDDRRTLTVSRKDLADGARRPRRGARPGPDVAGATGPPPGDARGARRHRWRTSRARLRAERGDGRRRRGGRVGGGDPRGRSRATRATSTRCCRGRAAHAGRAGDAAERALRAACRVLPDAGRRADRRSPSDAHPPDRATGSSRSRRAACADIARRLASARAGRRTAWRPRWTSGFSSTRRASCSAIGYRVAERRARCQLLRPAGVGGAPGELRRDREGRRAARRTGSGSAAR